MTDNPLVNPLLHAFPHGVPKDEVVGIAAISDHFIVATKRGKLYRVSKDDQDMVKLWVEIPV